MKFLFPSRTGQRDIPENWIREFDREIHAIPRGFGRWALRKRTGDGGFRARIKPRPAFFSVAELDGSDSLSIRPTSHGAKTRPTAYAERFVRSVKSECLARIILLGERHLRHAVKEYTEHYHVERNHQGIDNKLIEKLHGVININSAVERN